ncbi:MAG: glycoside hydrolase family 28 protein [Lachnospiraceae bacterium]|nr:glycoside hydrolase family 28 protein [Lachnospiraceae bacterium]
MMEGIYNIKEYREDTVPCREGRDWTDAFRRAAKDADAAGGGMLYVPAGRYPTRSIQLYSNTTLYLNAGAELYYLDDKENYEIVQGEFEGIASDVYMPCIFADCAHHVAVKGDGIINGNGLAWWNAVRTGTLALPRPYLIGFQYCEHVRIEGVTLLNAPAWTVHPLYCRDVEVIGVSIKNPYDSPNTDGINPDGCSNVRILNCQIDVGDDCITLKSGTEKTPRLRPCENITIANCTMIHGHGGIVIGSEMSGGIRNVTVSNCVFQNTDRGIRVKTRRRRGGIVENLHLSNLIMDRVMCPFVFNMYYNCGADGQEKYVWDKEAYPVDEGTPAIREVHISNVTVTGATAAAGFLYGLKEQPVRNVTLTDVSITMDPDGKPGLPAMMSQLKPMSGAGFFVRNAQEAVFRNVRIRNVRGAEIDGDNISITS